MLTLTDLRVTYPSSDHNEARSLCFNLSLNAGDWIAISGPSGAGKSSLLMALAGLIPIASGQIHWQTQAIHALPPAKRPIAMLFQHTNVFCHLSIKQNLNLVQKASNPKHTDPKAEIDEINLWAKRFKIESLLSKRPTELSGGQQQRAAIVRTLLQKKPILLLDEPLTGLDANLRHITIRWLKQLNLHQGLTLIMNTHHPEELPATGIKHLRMHSGGTLELFDGLLTSSAL